MAEDRINILDDLTVNQARVMLQLYLIQGAITASDVSQLAMGQANLIETTGELTKEERQGLLNKISLLHKTVGCSSYCKHTSSDGGSSGTM